MHKRVIRYEITNFLKNKAFDKDLQWFPILTPSGMAFGTPVPSEAGTRTQLPLRCPPRLLQHLQGRKWKKFRNWATPHTCSTHEYEEHVGLGFIINHNFHGDISCDIQDISYVSYDFHVGVSKNWVST